MIDSLRAASDRSPSERNAPARRRCNQSWPTAGLSLSGNPGITAAGLAGLLSAADAAEDAAPAALASLDVSECPLGPEGAHLLAARLASRGLGALRELAAYRCGLGAAGLLALARAAAGTPGLRSLNLAGNVFLNIRT